jgi:glucosyl-3-phosphoglycerate synthase
MMAPSLTVIVPAKNEADRIAHTVAALKSLACVSRVVVVDDASTDDTAAVAKQVGADAVIAGMGRGKGPAMEVGLRAADSAYVGFADADLGATAAEFAKIATPVLSGEADLAIAVFPMSGSGGGFGIAVKTARWGIRRLGGQTMRAPICGQRVMSLEMARKLIPFASGYGVEVGMTIDALRLGARIVEVPVNMGHRGHGKTLGGFMHRGRQLRDILRAFAARWRGKR